MIKALLGAVQFLTVLPIRSGTAPPGRSAVFFPFVGAWLGILGAAVLDWTHAAMPITIAALFVLAFWATITGALHEDGFADCADAFRAGRSPERTLAILKDSRIGAHGALALTLTTLIRWQALSAMAVEPVPALAAAQGLSRVAAVALAWITPPAGSGLGFALSNTMTTPVAVIAIVQGALLAAWCGGRLGAILAAGTAVIVLGARRYFVARIGGANGDCLGATGHVVEVFCLAVFTCRNCTS
jgi:adenosylcobinamide-GDP ribazoletransferase